MEYFDKILYFENLSLNAGPYYNGGINGVISGTFDGFHYNDDPQAIYSECAYTVIIYTSSMVIARTAEGMSLTPIFLNSEDSYQESGIQFECTLSGLAPGFYFIRIQKASDPNIYIQYPQPFQILKAPSSQKDINSFAFYKGDGLNANYWPAGIPDVIHGIVNKTLRTVWFEYPGTLDVTNLSPRIGISLFASINPLSLVARNFSSPVQYVVTAEDTSFHSYTVTGVAGAEAFLFIYDNLYTRIVPDKIERGQTINWFALIANSGAVANSGTENITVAFTDDLGNYYAQVYQGAVGAVNPYQDKEIFGSWVIPNDVPLGSDIKYYLSFHLNNSLIRRYLIVSSWSKDAVGIVFNKRIGAFIRETFSKSRFFAFINKDFYSLSKQDGSNQFFYHTDDIADGEIRLYNQLFYPSITFVINRSKEEKIYDSMMMHMNDVGVVKIEYWTETQYAIHEWPNDPLSQTHLRPWIDPEFREDKWYLPVHNEEIADFNYIADGNQGNIARITVVHPISALLRNTGTITVNGVEVEYVALDRAARQFIFAEPIGFDIMDQMTVIGIPGALAKTREMRGTWMKVKITFKPLRKFTLKNIATEFRTSNI